MNSSAFTRFVPRFFGSKNKPPDDAQDMAAALRADEFLHLIAE